MTIKPPTLGSYVNKDVQLFNGLIDAYLSRLALVKSYFSTMKSLVAW